MRPISGSIIFAGALIGLGLATLGAGIFWQNITSASDIRLNHLGAVYFGIAFTAAAAIVGMIITFVELAHHHEFERGHHLRGHHLSETPRTTP